MKIKRNKLSSYASVNRKYNANTSNFVQEMLQAYSLSPIDYFVLPEYYPNENKSPDRVNLVSEEIQINENIRNLYDLSEVGTYERILLSIVLGGEYKVYVVTGDVGSGKTATIHRIMSILDSGKHCRRGTENGCIGRSLTSRSIYLDFNGIHDPDYKVVSEHFYRSLFNGIYKGMKPIFSINGVMSAFIEKVHLENLADYDDFAILFDKGSMNDSWSNKSDAQKYNELFEYIKNDTNSWKFRGQMAARICRYANAELFNNSGHHDCFIIIFDNIDRLDPVPQVQILNEIIGLSRISNCKTLVPLRPTSFKKLESYSSYSFGCITHRGPSASDIVAKRLIHYRENWDELITGHALNANISKKLYNRVDLMCEKIKVRRIERFLDSLSGESVRLGLDIAKRYFINSVVDYKESPSYDNDINRALLVYDEDNIIINTDDVHIVNLFQNRLNLRLSLINLKLVKILYDHKEDKDIRRLSNMILIMNSMGYDNLEELRENTNFLLSHKRPIIWVDGKYQYRDLEEFVNSRDVLTLSESGVGYYEFLMTDLTYVQECLMALDWDSDLVPSEVDFSLTSERFRALEICLRELHQRDVIEMIKMSKWKDNGSGFNMYDKGIISHRIICGIGEAFYAIFHKDYNEEGRILEIYREVIAGWYALLIECKQKELDIAGRQSKQLTDLVKTYSQIEMLREV